MTNQNTFPNDKEDPSDLFCEEMLEHCMLDDAEADKVIGYFIRYLFLDGPPPTHGSEGKKRYLLGELLDWVLDRVDQNQISDLLDRVE